MITKTRSAGTTLRWYVKWVVPGGTGENIGDINSLLPRPICPSATTASMQPIFVCDPLPPLPRSSPFLLQSTLTSKAFLHQLFLSVTTYFISEACSASHT